MRNPLLKILLSFALVMATLPCVAFTLILGPQSQSTVGWKSKSVAFDVDTSCDAYRGVVDESIRSAAAVWATVPDSSLQVSLGNTVTLADPITTYVGDAATSFAPVGNPIVYCDESFSTNSGADAASIPGFATTPNMDADGKILGALLVLNVEANASANVTTLDATTTHIVLTHEIGHVLGLGHSANEKALMYYSVTPGNKAVLGQDDMDGISYLYPRREPFKDGFLACAAIQAMSSGDGSNGGSGFSEFLTLALIVLGAFGAWPRRLSQRLGFRTLMRTETTS